MQKQRKQGKKGKKVEIFLWDLTDKFIDLIEDDDVGTYMVIDGEARIQLRDHGYVKEALQQHLSLIQTFGTDKDGYYRFAFILEEKPKDFIRLPVTIYK